MSEEQESQRGRSGIGEGVRTGIGILTAFKDAIEETLQEAVNRGDLSPDRAREAVRNAASRVQEGFEGTRERFDFVSRRDFDDLRGEIATMRAEVAELRGRLQSHEGKTDHASGGAILPAPQEADAIAGDTADLVAEAGTLADSPGGGSTTGTAGEDDAPGMGDERRGGFPVDEGT